MDQKKEILQKSDDIKKAIDGETSAITAIYRQLNKIFGGSQLFVLEYPSRGINKLDYAYKIKDYNSSSILKPYVVAENEFRLTDSLMDMAPIVQGTNGKSLATEYKTVLNNFTPKIDDITGYITDKMELRLFLLETITDQIGGQQYTCSRMEFCQRLYLYYLEQKAKWDQEKFEKNQEAVANNTLNEYAAWLSTTAWTKDKELETLFNDAIVRGFYHEIMTILGFIDTASPAERLETAKTNLRTSVRRRIDGSGEVYPVSLSPSDWFRALTPNYSPKDLLADPDFVMLEYQQKKAVLTALQNDLRILLSQQASTDVISNLQTQIDNGRKELDRLEGEYAQQYGESAVSVIKLVLQVVSNGSTAEFLAGKTGEMVANALDIDQILKMIGLDTSDENKTSISTLAERMSDMYINHIEYFKAYEDLMALKLSEAKILSEDRKETIQLLEERIAILSADVTQLEVILASGVLKSDEKSDDTDNPDKTDDSDKTDDTDKTDDSDKTDDTDKTDDSDKTDDTDKTDDSDKTDDTETAESIFPVSKYDTDGMFSEITITNEETSDSVNSDSQALTTNLSGGVNTFLWRTSVNTNFSESTNEFVKAVSSSKIQIGMRVMKVSIERGGWFDPGIIDISKSYMHIRDSIKASNGYNADDCIAVSNGKKTKDTSVLPGFPSAFLIAKDIHIKASGMKCSEQQYNDFRKASLATSTSICGIRLSGNVAMQSEYSDATHTDTVTGVTIKIPGPQIIGWFMQLTPEDKSSQYVPLSGDGSTPNYFDQIIDKLKDYREKMKQLNGSASNSSFNTFDI